MRLKLLSPVATPSFGLRSPRVQQSPEAYGAAWRAASEALGSPPALDGDGLSVAEQLRFVHDPRFWLSPGSRYQTIDRHSLVRPLHAVELVVQLGAPVVERGYDRGEGRLLAPDREKVGEAASAWREVLRGQAGRSGHRALVRVFDHGVTLIELDLPPPDPHAIVDPAGAAATLNLLQQVGIGIVEVCADRVAQRIVPDLVAWVRRRAPDTAEFLAERTGYDERLESGSRRDGAALWVTRTLILEEGDPVATSAELRRLIVEHWLKDVPERSAAEDAGGGRGDRRGEGGRGSEGGPPPRPRLEPTYRSIRWLNYFFAEGAYPGAYPERGWTRDERGVAVPFCPDWDALVIAQYYYSAYDLLQSTASRILAISISREVARPLGNIRAMLDATVRASTMLTVEFYENAKYYARASADTLAEVLASWNFESHLLRQTEGRIEECARRLGELQQKGIERSAFYSELILLGLATIAVFEILLALSDFGRSMSASSELMMYEQSPFNVADWVGRRATDALLLAAAVITGGLVVLYAFVRAVNRRG
ncbi:MAG: hypothetical protein ACFCGT_03310 [Sandaracinaceae bacterium]